MMMPRIVFSPGPRRAPNMLQSGSTVFVPSGAVMVLMPPVLTLVVPSGAVWTDMPGMLTFVEPSLPVATDMPGKFTFVPPLDVVTTRPPWDVLTREVLTAGWVVVVGAGANGLGTKPAA